MRSRKCSSRVRGIYDIRAGFKVTKPYDWAPIQVEYVGYDGMPLTDKWYLTAALEPYATVLTEAGYTSLIISSIHGPRVLVTRQD